MLVIKFLKYYLFKNLAVWFGCPNDTSTPGQLAKILAPSENEVSI